MKAKLTDLIALNNWMLDAPLDEERSDIRSKKAAMLAIRELTKVTQSYKGLLEHVGDTDQIDWDASVSRMIEEACGDETYKVQPYAIANAGRVETLVGVGDPDPVKKPVEKKPRRKPFDWPASPDGVKAHRLGTKRAHVVETLMGDGATFDEIAAHCGWDRRTCYEGIKLIHSMLGYGLSEDPDTGIIRAFVA